MRSARCLLPLCACKHCKLRIGVHAVSMEAQHDATTAAQLPTGPAAATTHRRRRRVPSVLPALLLHLWGSF